MGSVPLAGVGVGVPLGVGGGGVLGGLGLGAGGPPLLVALQPWLPWLEVHELPPLVPHAAPPEVPLAEQELLPLVDPLLPLVLHEPPCEPLTLHEPPPSLARASSGADTPIAMRPIETMRARRYFTRTMFPHRHASTPASADLRFQRRLRREGHLYAFLTPRHRPVTPRP
jgi:hypothetical protein